MNHLGTVQIETDRLQLRKFNKTDSRALFNNWANDVEVTDLSLGYIVIDEGVPLISDRLVLEMNRKFLKEPINFLGVTGYYPFKYGKMFGERTGVDTVGEIWDRFFRVLPNISHISEGRWVGVSYHGDAPDGYSSYFVGAEVKKDEKNPGFTNWQLPIREYIVCGFESENHEQMIINMGKAMKYTRFWLKKHNLIADGFFPEMYYKSTSDISYVELWIPFKKREKQIINSGGKANEQLRRRIKINRRKVRKRQRQCYFPRYNCAGAGR